MERQMRRMGVDYKQMEGVNEVIIRFPDKEIVITNPQVVTIQAQGENIYQIIGQPEQRTSTISSEVSSETKKKELFTEEDVQLVASQANVSEEEARNALKEADGNLAKAIIALTGG